MQHRNCIAVNKRICDTDIVVLCFDYTVYILIGFADALSEFIDDYLWVCHPFRVSDSHRVAIDVGHRFAQHIWDADSFRMPLNLY